MRIFLLALLVSGFAARADDTPPPINSQYLHQTDDKRFDVTPDTMIVVQSAEFKGKDAKLSKVTLPFAVAGEYGINQNFSAGLDLGYAHTAYNYTCNLPTVCSDTTSKGFLDPVIFFKSQFPVGPGVLRAGVNFSFALEHAKVDASGNGNEASGANTVTPFVAYELPLWRGIGGGRVMYDIYKSDGKFDDGQTNFTGAVTGGKVLGLDVFYEVRFRKVTFGGALLARIKDESRNTENGSSTLLQDGGTLVAYQAYVPVHLGDTDDITLLPAITVGGYSLDSDSQFSRESLVVLDFGARFRF